MSSSAHYVTQQGLWAGAQIGKALTDRRIAQLQRQGHYGSAFVRLQAVEKKRRVQKESVAELFANF